MKWFCKHEWKLGYIGFSYHIAFCKNCFKEKRFHNMKWAVYQAKQDYKNGEKNE